MNFKGWDKVQIHTRQGMVEGIAPVIISASRATDIPAFYAEWFIQRLDEGYTKWINPFNRKEQYVSFAKTRVLVFWSKNPYPIVKYLDLLDDKKLNYYFTYSLNDYESEGFEPNLPPLTERIRNFQELSGRIGKEKVIWRFDPLILTDKLSTQELLAKIYAIAEKLKGFTEKLVISFVDIHNYAKVQRNLRHKQMLCKEFDEANMHEMAKGLSKLKQLFDIEVATCGEAVDLTGYGITKNKCIDDVLMHRLFQEDVQLMNFLGYAQQGQLFQEEQASSCVKDKGQRVDCGCVVSKDIGQYNTCPFLCCYCYANDSDKSVITNWRQFNAFNK